LIVELVALITIIIGFSAYAADIPNISQTSELYYVGWRKVAIYNKDLGCRVVAGNEEFAECPDNGQPVIRAPYTLKIQPGFDDRPTEIDLGTRYISRMDGGDIIYVGEKARFLELKGSGKRNNFKGGSDEELSKNTIPGNKVKEKEVPEVGE
jgi:hypothetical protein